MRYFYRLLGFCLLIFCSSDVYAQLLINEVSSNNYQGHLDNDGDNSDWIELYNAGTESVDLTGYRITDDPLFLAKWTFPAVSIPAGGYLTLFASKKNRFDYIDHWESLAKETDVWKYLIPESEPSSSWRKAGFDDSAWLEGQGGFGYGDGDDTTEVATGTKAIFLRKELVIVDSSHIQDLILDIDYDDGFVAYLNGTEIIRSNITGTPSFDKSADADREAKMYTGGSPERFRIDASLFKPLLRTGTNVLAIQIHNVSSSSSDLSCRPFFSCGVNTSALNYSSTPDWFTAPGSGTYLHTNFAIKAGGGETLVLTNPAGATVDQIAVPSLEVDNSYGRYPNGGEAWSLLAPVTPDASNGAATPIQGYIDDPVIFSLAAGFYTSSQSLSLSTAATGCTIRYTTDGSKPTPSSSSYSSPISISSNRVVKAGCFRSGYLTRNIEGNTYFINDGSTLPVVSISTHPGNFFSSDSGIYVKGPNAEGAFPYFGANFWEDWEREIHFEYFLPNGTQAFEQNMGVKIFGGWSRGQSMKSLRIVPRDMYGPSKINYKLFADKDITSFDRVILRNAGNDFNYTHFRDAINHKVLVKSKQRHGMVTHMDFQAYQPVLVFINGEYWGVHNIREHISHHHPAENHGVNDDNVDFLEMEGVINEGSNEHFIRMVNFIHDNDMTSASNYEQVKQMLDIENYVDYFAAQSFHTNWDFPHNNIKYWRDRTGGKWRYFYYDTDFGYGLFDFNSASSNELQRIIDDNRTYHSSMFKRLLTNTEFKNYFVNRYADLLNTTYKVSNLQSVVDELKAGIEPEMSRHFSRWGDNSGGISGWESNISGVKNFITYRTGNVRDHIVSEFGLSGKVDITLDVAPAGAGKIKISTVIPDTYPWTGTYFNGVPVTVTAEANNGYVFSGWSGLSGSTDISIIRNFTTDGTLTANFTESSATARVVFSEINYNADSATSAGEWVEIHNYGNIEADLSGWVFKDDKDFNEFVFPAGTILPAGGYLVIVKDPVKFSAKHPDVTNYIGPYTFNLNNAGDHIRLFTALGTLKTDVIFDDASPWPTIADGGGTTLELKDPAADLHDPANWFDGCMNGSPGTPYVECPCTQFELGPDRILCMEDGSVNLTTGLEAHPDRIFKWFYNDTELTGYNYPSLTVSAAGEYVVIVDSAKCFKSDYVNIEEAFTVNLGPDIGLCSPMSKIFDAFVPGEGISYQWEKDGEILVEEVSSSLNITAPGTYQVTVSAGSCTPVTDQVVVVSDAAKPVDAARCGEGSVTLGIEGTSSYEWYTDQVGGTLVGEGSTFTTPVLYDTTTYYVEDAGFFYYTGGPADTSFGDTWSHNDFAGYKLKFNVLAPFVLRSVTVFAGSSQDVTIRVLAADGSTVLHSKTISVSSAGKHVIPLGFQLAVGNGYFMDAVGTSGRLRMNNENASFPYEVPGYLNIYRTEPDWADDQGWYFFFYNWEVTSGPGPCDRVPVTAYINCMQLQAYITPSGSTTVCEGGSVDLVANFREHYSYQWYRNGTLIVGEVLSTFTASEAGDYTVEVSDGEGTIMSEPTTVVVSALPLTDVTESGPLEFCDGGNVTLTASSGTGYTYAWYRNGTAITGATSISYSATSSGDYTVQVTSNGCSSSSAPKTVTEHPYPAATITTSGPTGVCEGGSVLLSAPTASGYTYQWYRGDLLITDATTSTHSASVTGDYSVNVSANGCTSASVIVKVSVAPAPEAAITVEGSTELCEGETAVLRASTGSGYTYKWFNNGTAITNATSSYYNADSAGSYTVEVILNGCSTVSPAVGISVAPAPEAVVAADGPTTFCEGGSVLLTASAGTGYTYQWHNGTSAIVGATGGSFDVSASGNYSVTVTLENCSSSSPVTSVSVLPLPDANITADGPLTFCDGDSVLLSASAGSNYTYQWYNGSTTISGATAGSYTALSSGEYSVKVTSGACSDSSSATSVTVQPLPDAVVTAGGPTTFCEGGSVLLSASVGTGYTYQWFNGNTALSSETGSSYTASSSGDYSVVVTSGSCTSTSSTMSVVVLPNPVAEITADGPLSFCDGASVTLSVASSIGYTYQWYRNDGLLSTETTNALTTGTSGTYAARVSSENCSSTSQPVVVSVTENPVASITTSGSTTFCEGESSILQASTGTGYSWQWLMNGSDIADATSSALNASASGNYSVKVTANGCTVISDEIQIIVKPRPAAAITATGATTFCTGGSVLLTASSGTDYTYQWHVNGGAITDSTSASFTAKSSGTYSVTVSLNGCSNTSSETNVTAKEMPLAEITVDGPTQFCQGNSVLLSSSEGTGYTYQWYDGAAAISTQTSSSYTVTESGSYSAVVSLDGCTQQSDAVTVDVIVVPGAADAGSDQLVCSSETELNANVPVVGTGKWTVLSGTAIVSEPSNPYSAVSGLGQGVNQLEWSISNGECTSEPDTVIITVSETSSASVSISASNNPVCAGSSVTFTASTVNGGSEAVFDWYVNNVAAGVSTKTYTMDAPSDADVVHVVMTSSLSCATGSPATSNRITVSVEGNPSVSVTGDDQEICANQAMLQANAPVIGSGVWMLVSGNANIADRFAPGTSVTLNSTGPHIFRWTIYNDPCQASSDEVLIQVSEPADQANAGEDQYITTTTTSLEGNFPLNGIGTWSVLSGAGIFDMDTDPLTEVTGLAEGENIFRWTFTSGACESTYDDISVHVGQEPVTGGISGPDSVVLGRTYMFSIPADSTASFFWTVPSGASITSGQGTNEITVVYVSYFGGSITVTKTTPYGSATQSKTIHQKMDPTGLGLTFERSCKVYPNPAEGDVYFHVSGIDSDEVDLTIINQKGVVRYVVEGVRNNETIRLPDLEPDVYLIQVKGNSRTEHLKLIKLK